MCEICTFPLDVTPSEKPNNEKMSYLDFIIQKEHKLLRNVLSEDDLQKSKQINNIENYHEIFKKYLKICIFIENSFNLFKNVSECHHYELIEFINENLPDVEKFCRIKRKN